MEAENNYFSISDSESTTGSSGNSNNAVAADVVFALPAVNAQPLPPPPPPSTRFRCFECFEIFGSESELLQHQNNASNSTHMRSNLARMFMNTINGKNPPPLSQPQPPTPSPTPPRNYNFAPPPQPPPSHPLYGVAVGSSFQQRFNPYFDRPMPRELPFFPALPTPRDVVDSSGRTVDFLSLLDRTTPASVPNQQRFPDPNGIDATPVDLDLDLKL